QPPAFDDLVLLATLSGGKLVLGGKKHNLIGAARQVIRRTVQCLRRRRTSPRSQSLTSRDIINDVLPVLIPFGFDS
ncbi:hypothetical protein ACPPTU_22695, partial [Ralstonia pseudosolanacearum]|uniref:hypothetical protein n=1 Tax=Ralstonia pseudosolanacearum TaxID=1310165 RepID=UPI003C7A7DDC